MNYDVRLISATDPERTVKVQARDARYAVHCALHAAERDNIPTDKLVSIEIRPVV